MDQLVIVFFLGTDALHLLFFKLNLISSQAGIYCIRIFKLARLVTFLFHFYSFSSDVLVYFLEIPKHLPKSLLR